MQPADSSATLSNAEIADRLLSLAQLLSSQKENPFKIKAYQRAARKIKELSESVAELVHDDADLTQYSGIGKAIASAIREIVGSGTIRQLESLRSQVTPELAALTEYPRLDPKRVMRIYKKLRISSIAELKERLESGAIAETLGARMDQHVRQALEDTHELLLYEADFVAQAAENFLMEKCRVSRAQVAGDYRRRTETVREISFLIETRNFESVVGKMERYGGKAELLRSSANSSVFRLSSGILLKIETAEAEKWGVALMAATGSARHLQKLRSAGADFDELGGGDVPYRTEEAAYEALGLSFIEPELREGGDEVERAARGPMPKLVTVDDIRGELHAHSTSSDGSNTIEEMAAAARKKGYEYVGITDHSQSLKIAGGLSPDDLWKQIRFIDKVNGTLAGIRVLKSAEVDILADGSLDYADELLKELDYTVCSIHSKFGLGKAAQTDRILRAMDNRYFTILGHATGRLLLKRPGYEIDMGRVVEQARANGCFFEINSSPDRLDLSAENARLAREARVKIAIDTDAHAIREFNYVRGGVDQARRAGLEKQSILNCHAWPELQRLFRR